MNNSLNKKTHPIIGGLITGLFNGLLGAGGGMLAIPFLSRTLEPKKAHATCVAIIMPICISSALWYIFQGNVKISDAAPYIPWGVAGALVGTFVLRKLNNNVIKKLFSVFMLWAGIRMIWR